MHDLDRSDLVFESDGFDAGLEELEEADLGDEEGVFDSAEQSELAGELLNVSSEHELDQFLGDLIKGAVSKLGPIRGKLAKNLGGYLKGAIKKTLPSVASIAGGMFGGPAGAMIAGKAAPYLSSILGMELEGLSPEDQEFEAAKQLVRLAGSAIKNAAGALGGNPADIARNAVVDAARQYAPGLVRRAGAIASRAVGVVGDGQQGTWYRRGNKIVIVGV